MSFRVIHVPKSSHSCGPLPSTDSFPIGTYLECETCEQKWVLVWGTQYNEIYRAWRKLTDKNKDGRDVL